MSSRATTPAGRRRAADRLARATPAPTPETPTPAAHREAPPTPARTTKARRAPARPAKPAPWRARPAKPPARRRPTGRAEPRHPASLARRAGARIRALRLPTPSLPRLRSPRSPRRWAIGAVVVVLALTALYYGWLRDSSLVAVDKVEVDGLGAGAGPAIAALRSAGEGMTTLDVDQGRLEAVAAQFPEIAAVSADADFPHGLTIHVTARPPVLVAHDGDRDVPVAGDGTILAGDRVPAAAKLPSLAVHPLPASGRLTGNPLQQALVLGAAPAPLRREVARVSFSADHGVTATMRGGIEVRFGAAGDTRDKWAAAAAVLADRRLTTAAYVDVRVPRRPAVG